MGKMRMEARGGKYNMVSQMQRLLGRQKSRFRTKQQN
jgi:hypothetical protein